jgi:hypothetical protein
MKDSEKKQAVPDLLLERYLAGDLPEEVQTRVKTTLKEDAALRERLDVLRATRTEFIIADPPAQFAHRVVARTELNKRMNAPQGSRWGRFLRWGVGPSLAAACSLVLAVTVSDYLKTQNYFAEGAEAPAPRLRARQAAPTVKPEVAPPTPKPVLARREAPAATPDAIRAKRVPLVEKPAFVERELARVAPAEDVSMVARPLAQVLSAPPVLTLKAKSGALTHGGLSMRTKGATFLRKATGGGYEVVFSPRGAGYFLVALWRQSGGAQLAGGSLAALPLENGQRVVRVDATGNDALYLIRSASPFSLGELVWREGRPELRQSSHPTERIEPSLAD